MHDWKALKLNNRSLDTYLVYTTLPTYHNNRKHYYLNYSSHGNIFIYLKKLVVNNSDLIYLEDIR